MRAVGGAVALSALSLSALLVGLATSSPARATPPPTEEEAKRLREAAAQTECVHCAGRGDPHGGTERACAYLTPYGFERGARYLDGPRHGRFFCRPRSSEAAALPNDLRAKAENGEDDPAAETAKIGPSRAGCAHRELSGDPRWSGLLVLVALASLGRRRSPAARAAYLTKRRPDVTR